MTVADHSCEPTEIVLGIDPGEKPEGLGIELALGLSHNSEPTARGSARS